MAAGDFRWGGRLLNDNVTYFVIDAKPPAVPINLLALDLGRIEGSGVADVRYMANEIGLTLGVRGATFAAAEAAYDAIIADFYRGEQNLFLGFQDERYWPSRLRALDVVRDVLLLYELHCTFFTPSAFGYALNLSSMSNSSALSLVSGNHYRKTMQPTVGGSIYTRPTITITFPAGGGSPFGATQVYVENASLSPAPRMTVARTWAANDVLVIDGTAQTVKVNGTEVDYSGQFVNFDPRVSATNDITINVIATSVPTVTAAFSWRARYAA